MQQEKKRAQRKRLFDIRYNRAWSENLTFVMQLGLTMAGCIFFCFFIGRFLDRLLGTGGILMTIFIFLGIIGGGNVVYRQIMEMVASDQPRNGGSRRSENGKD